MKGAIIVDNIAEKLQIIQDGINTEGDLINQIAAALEGKSGNGEEGSSYPYVTVNFELDENNFISAIQTVNIIEGEAIESYDTSYSELENKLHTYSLKIPAGTYLRLIVDQFNYDYAQIVFSVSSYEALINQSFEISPSIGWCYCCPIKDITITVKCTYN